MRSVRMKTYTGDIIIIHMHALRGLRFRSFAQKDSLFALLSNFTHTFIVMLQPRQAGLEQY